MIETSRAPWRDYLDPEKLGMVAGCASIYRAVVAVKELVDNALDESGDIGIEIIDRDVVVQDTGTGMDEATACRIFSVSRDSRSSKSLRMARRGMLGYGSRIIAAAAHVSGGLLTVESRGLGLRLGVSVVDGAATGHERFASDVTVGTRITLAIGQHMNWNADHVEAYVQNALLARGVTYPGKKACGAWFDQATMRNLLRDAVPPSLTALEFARVFDLTPAALATIKEKWARLSTAELYDHGRT